MKIVNLQLILVESVIYNMVKWFSRNGFKDIYAIGFIYDGRYYVYSILLDEITNYHYSNEYEYYKLEFKDITEIPKDIINSSIFKLLYHHSLVLSSNFYRELLK